MDGSLSRNSNHGRPHPWFGLTNVFFHIQEKSPNLLRIQRRSIACPCINKHTCIVMYHFEDLVKI
jgi:hypothetical protein